MVRYYFNIIVKSSCCILLFGVTSCKDILEEDIQNQMVTMIIPQADDTLTTNSVHFKWHEMDGADEYRLQVVSPSFSDISSFELDSLISGTEFYYALNPGNYEFQIRGENSAYESVYSGPYAFQIDSVSDLSNQVVPIVQLGSPYYTNLSDVSVQWQSVFAADYYEFQLRSGSNFNSSTTTLVTEPVIYGNAFATSTAPLSAEGEYSWGVRAINNNSQSQYSSEVIYVDLTNPNDVSLLSPSDGFNNSNDTVLFKWDSGTDPGSINSPISYVLELDVNASFTSLTEYNTSADSLKLVLSSNTYYWRVKALDEAGNQSVYYSPEYSVIIP